MNKINCSYVEISLAEFHKPRRPNILRRTPLVNKKCLGNSKKVTGVAAIKSENIETTLKNKYGMQDTPLAQPHKVIDIKNSEKITTDINFSDKEEQLDKISPNLDCITQDHTTTELHKEETRKNQVTAAYKETNIIETQDHCKESRDDLTKKSPKKIYCPAIVKEIECNQIFMNRNKLFEHMKKDHSILDAPFKCLECPKRFFFKVALMGHLRMHMMLKSCSLVCDWPECGKRFFYACRLKEHKRVHTGDRPYLCNYDVCQRSFRTASKLLRHKRTHTNYKPHFCTKCNKSFYRREYLRVHIDSVHKAKEKILPYSSNLSPHIQKEDDQLKKVCDNILIAAPSDKNEVIDIQINNVRDDNVMNYESPADCDITQGIIIERVVDSINEAELNIEYPIYNQTVHHDGTFKIELFEPNQVMDNVQNCHAARTNKVWPFQRKKSKRKPRQTEKRIINDCDKIDQNTNTYNMNEAVILADDSVVLPAMPPILLATNSQFLTGSLFLSDLNSSRKYLSKDEEDMQFETSELDKQTINSLPDRSNVNALGWPETQSDLQLILLDSNERKRNSNMDPTLSSGITVDSLTTDSMDAANIILNATNSGQIESELEFLQNADEYLQL